MAKKPPSSEARIFGATPGTMPFAVSSHFFSKRLRSTGASQTCATRSRGRARLTATGPDFRSMRQISEETPPASATAFGFSPGPARPCFLRKARTSSGSEALNLPGAAAARIEEPVMQPVLASLPEFDPLRDHPVAAPIVRPRGIVTVGGLFFLDRGLQKRAIRNDRALNGSACRQARARGPARKVLVGFLSAHLPDAPFDAHLPLELRPQEHEAGLRPCRELAALAALVVRIEDEAAVVHALEEHRARIRGA